MCYSFALLLENINNIKEKNQYYQHAIKVFTIIYEGSANRWESKLKYFHKSNFSQIYSQIAALALKLFIIDHLF